MILNDHILDKKEVWISPDDRGYYFGDGVYEVFRIYGGRMYEFNAHLSRLQRSAREIGLSIPYAQQHVKNQLQQLIELDHVRDGTLYLQITRGVSSRVHAFPQNTPTVLTAYCNHLIRPIELMKKGISVILTEDIRWHRCDIKSLNLLPNLLAKQNAVEQGFGEAILHRNNIVTECSASNVMIVKGGVVWTHPANQWILHGVTRAVVLRLASELGISVYEREFSIIDLKEAEEVFITSTTADITPVTQIDDITVGHGYPGRVTQMLQAAFERTISPT